jgi:acetyltransferase-like isoleucine patch superfamily enzyme
MQPPFFAVIIPENSRNEHSGNKHGENGAGTHDAMGCRFSPEAPGWYPSPMKRHASGSPETSTLIGMVFRSRPLQFALTLVIYAFYAAVFGAALTPSALLARWAYGRLFGSTSAAPAAAGRIMLFCLSLGAGAFLFLFCALLLTGLIARVLSRGVRPGRHPAASPTTLPWMFLNGLHTIVFRAFLPLVPMTFFSMMYFRLAGCRIGHDVWITTPFLLDPHLISIGDGTVIGGDAVLTTHLFEKGILLLAPITIGRDCSVGAHALISPGVAVGDRATIGMRVILREGKRVPAGAHIASLDGLPYERVLDLEGRRRRSYPGR